MFHMRPELHHKDENQKKLMDVSSSTTNIQTKKTCGASNHNVRVIMEPLGNCMGFFDLQQFSQKKNHYFFHKYIEKTHFRYAGK